MNTLQKCSLDIIESRVESTPPISESPTNPPDYVGWELELQGAVGGWIAQRHFMSLYLENLSQLSEA